jgi:tetratricopeptide (TPR) repeat protein
MLGHPLHTYHPRHIQFTVAAISLGGVLFKKGDVNGAIDAYQCAIANSASPERNFSPHEPNGHDHDLSDCFDAQGQAAGAATDTATPARFPAQAVALYHLGNSHAYKGDYGNAIASYRSAIALAPQRADVHISLGLAQLHNDDLESSIASYQTAIGIDSTHVVATYNLGLALEQRGDLNEGIFF